MFKPDLELRQAVFEEMGAEWHEDQDAKGGLLFQWWLNNNPISDWTFCEEPSPELLPPIETSWEVCAEYLVPWMRERGYTYFVLDQQMDIDGTTCFHFGWDKKGMLCDFTVIKNDNLPKAACEVFMDVALEAVREEGDDGAK